MSNIKAINNISRHCRVFDISNLIILSKMPDMNTFNCYTSIEWINYLTGTYNSILKYFLCLSSSPMLMKRFRCLCSGHRKKNIQSVKTGLVSFAWAWSSKFIITQNIKSLVRLDCWAYNLLGGPLVMLIGYMIFLTCS